MNCQRANGPAKLGRFRTGACGWWEKCSVMHNQKRMAANSGGQSYPEQGVKSRWTEAKELQD